MQLSVIVVLVDSSAELRRDRLPYCVLSDFQIFLFVVGFGPETVTMYQWKLGPERAFKHGSMTGIYAYEVGQEVDSCCWEVHNIV